MAGIGGRRFSNAPDMTAKATRWPIHIQDIITTPVTSATAKMKRLSVRLKCRMSAGHRAAPYSVMANIAAEPTKFMRGPAGQVR